MPNSLAGGVMIKRKKERKEVGQRVNHTQAQIIFSFFFYYFPDDQRVMMTIMLFFFSE